MMRRILLVILGLVFSAHVSFAAEIYGIDGQTLDLYAGDEFLARWLVPQAREAVDRLLRRSPGSRTALIADAHVDFFEGRYKNSLEALDKAAYPGGFRNLVRATVDATKAMKSRKSAHFEIFWADPKDEILVDDGLLGLEAARSALEKQLGYISPTSVRVEIYPTAADFIAVSTLTRKEVDTTGIVGLCKFDRLLITSPRATLWGYRWRDTLSHEYVHLAIYRMSGGEAPIWVHEGIAKYLEGAWRGKLGGLEPASLALLADRASKDSLVPLEKMSPSIAKLPSAEDATLAFAEVATMMDYLARKRGTTALAKIVTLIGSGKTDRQALAQVWGAPFEDFEGEWKKWVRALPKTDEKVEIVAVELKEGKEDTESDADRVADPAARDFLRLGDMLRLRGREGAAATEYGKAFELSPKSPIVVSRHALGRIALADYEGAVKAVDGVLDLYADMAVLWSRKGEALFELGRFEEARKAYRELMEINPFHLPGRMGLLEIAEKTGDKAGAESARKIMELLSGSDDTLPAGHGAVRERKEF